MIYLELFISFLKIGLFSFGGGYAAMPLIQDQVVTARQWLSMPEFTDLVTISQMTPEEELAYQQARIIYLEKFIEFQKKIPSLLEAIHTSSKKK